MDVVLKYRGRLVSESDIEIVRALIQQHPGVSRRELSRRLCHAWNWVQANGAPCDMVCRSLMLTLERWLGVTPSYRANTPTPKLPA